MVNSANRAKKFIRLVKFPILTDTLCQGIVGVKPREEEMISDFKSQI